MLDLRTKIFGLAGALLCSGMAYGAAAGPGGACTNPSSTTALVRAEGTTELVATLSFTCTLGPQGAGLALPAAAGFAAQIFLSPSIPATSKVLNSTTGSTEALLTITSNNATAGANLVSVTNGTISGSTINFSGTLPNLAVGGVNTAPAAGDVLTVTLSNIRVNATSLSVGTGLPPSISETVFLSGAAFVPAALQSTTVGFAQNGLGSISLRQPAAGITAGTVNAVTASTSTGANNFVICNGYNPRDSGFGGFFVPGALAAVVQVRENFASAFKNAAGEASNSLTTNATTGISNVVVDGTRIAVNFANVPSNVTLYVPTALITTVGTGTTATIQLTGSGPGTAFAPVSASTASNLGTALLAPVSVSGGAGTATFEVITPDNTNLDIYNIPVYIVSTANSVPGSATALTITVNFSPVGSTVIPNFAVGSSTSTLTGPKFSLCTTSLLLPFVTNQLGFDTGIAIANTSTDPFGTAGATPQSGTCTLNFYGNGAPTPANVTTANIPSGTVYAAPLSSVAAGFQGYIITQCTFQFAHGFVFITNGVGANGGLSQGYLAGVLPDFNQVSRTAATVESLGQ